ncbi:5'-AMP-activated protein kinase subunit gamma-3 [Chelonoidis abingdonii]|uniref:5'-AMP-activated protein kinase subunit gamma-3 n=1 Tax=Chelonoidis abingdonii TaxID=106734 RepID=UPI003F494E3F
MEQLMAPAAQQVRPPATRLCSEETGSCLNPDLRGAGADARMMGSDTKDAGSNTRVVGSNDGSGTKAAGFDAGVMGSSDGSGTKAAGPDARVMSSDTEAAGSDVGLMGSSDGSDTKAAGSDAGVMGSSDGSGTKTAGSDARVMGSSDGSDTKAAGSDAGVMGSSDGSGTKAAGSDARVMGSSDGSDTKAAGSDAGGPEVPAQGSPVPPPIAASVSPSLFNAVYQLIKNRIHRLPVIEPVSGNVLHILTHKRILKFLHIFGAMLPRPRFLQRTIQELGVGTFRDVAKVLETASVYMALETFVDRRVSALPVTNEAGEVVGLYSRFDVIVHRLVLVDEKNSLRGIVSLSDILQALVLSPAGISRHSC